MINFSLGDLVTHTESKDISAVSGRLLDNPGELACTSYGSIIVVLLEGCLLIRIIITGV